MTTTDPIKTRAPSLRVALDKAVKIAKVLQFQPRVPVHNPCDKITRVQGVASGPVWWSTGASRKSPEPLPGLQHWSLPQATPALWKKDWLANHAYPNRSIGHFAENERSVLFSLRKQSAVSVPNDKSWPCKWILEFWKPFIQNCYLDSVSTLEYLPDEIDSDITKCDSKIKIWKICSSQQTRIFQIIQSRHL